MTQLEPRLDGLKFEIQDDAPVGTKIKVIGVGGGGSNAVGRMMQFGIQGVEYYVINTDRQALNASAVTNKLLIGHRMTNGLGAGADPGIGRESALEDTERIIEILEGSDMVFVTAGMGGGTGTGAAPVVASLAKELNALTVAVVTKPFFFEGPRRMRIADRGLAELAATVDTLIQIPNERLTTLVPRGTPLLESFRAADDVLRQAVQGISDIMNTPGLINRDFSDIRAIMQGMGHAMMGTAAATGEDAAVEAARKAIHCPLLEETEMRGARGILINITASSRISLHEVHDACSLICGAAKNEDAMVNFGIVLDEDMGDEVKVTVIATGFERAAAQEPRARLFTGATLSTPELPIGSIVESVLTSRQEEIPMPAVEPEPAEELAPAMSMAAAASSPAVRAASSPPPLAEEPVHDMDDLEIPAFLRRDRRSFSAP
ncbi:MAG: cell division protein FtsZ [Acidobacteria bacterium]|nr:cell division protein FtsZ [Acidobacteriota bacterium]